MNLDRAVDRAEREGGPKGAAKLFNDIEYELALGDPSPEQEHQGEKALRVLEQRFPGVRQAAQEVEAPPALSRSAGESLRSENGGKPVLQARPRAQHQAERRVGTRTLRSRAGYATAIHARSRRSRGGGSVLPPATRDTVAGIGRTLVWGVELIVGLVLLGLLVSPRGSGAFTTGSGLLARLLERIANPYADPLAGLSHSTGSSGGHDIPIVPYGKRPPKDPNNPTGPKKLLPRPHPFPILPPVNTTVPVTVPEIPIIDIPIPTGPPLPDFLVP